MNLLPLAIPGSIKPEKKGEWNRCGFGYLPRVRAKSVWVLFGQRGPD